MWRFVLIILMLIPSFLGYQRFSVSILSPTTLSTTIDNTDHHELGEGAPTTLSQLTNIISDPPPQPFKSWVAQQGFDLNPQVLDSITAILNYANANQIEHNHILTLIDYSIPANQKRLWVFDLEGHRVLFHTYVSHGIKSGGLESRFFSNRFNSKASSIGVFRTNQTYFGRHGLSLRLDGLDRGFNDNADSRTIVMHGGWYVEESFIKKYGRAGRSWGCPAVPDQLTADIISTIKDKSLFIVYYPSMEWFEKSRFLQHDGDNSLLTFIASSITPEVETEKHEEVLLAQISKKNHGETEAILAMPADRYTTLFQTKAPLERMLRRQIDKEEYIALSKTEFDHLLILYPQNQQTFEDICLILPEIKMIRGYYATEMRKINFGSITEIQTYPPNIPTTECTYYTLHFSKHGSLAFKPTNRFIRWLGL